ncbi:hypothetical protein [Luteimonas fraxinea]|uniref:Post-SET domain-containing protein n=1 Tax=Luteimonas fraxinea TaxID=2901869 RepID=A0ABS8UC30_9GAMM|nr:hypothetical protein [Luteimonas fraxinea]MCD9097062.1 hypothetical protein [Luteimonas fraxinea]
MHHALAIAQKPQADWQAAIEAVPAECPHRDCSGGIGCRERVSAYMRVQWRMLTRRKARAPQSGPA